MRAAKRLISILRESGIRVEAAFLFGSRVRGDSLRLSDVDLVVVSPDFQSMRYSERLELIYRLEWIHGIEPWVEVIPLTPEEFEEKKRHSAVLRDASRYWIRIE
ncbi:hypothetical protein PYJP_02750 [Pyrofollis japonicus]|uniref:nucleotidyltransferase domain-containing protein n=1 Tax=Pyrofollis japonicus TaxID=3060460 RepID=UPI00295A80DA|nr:nucleotidyltransferase domain-containing protein [Pyrofollis japonicus]BEP16923.1 hypothetical protein PYJP_02750 [Pyrofollis japonicus]